MWAKLKAACAHSATVAWTYLLLIWSAALENLDQVAAALGDPNLDQQIRSLLGTDAKIIARYTAVVAIITLAARARSLIRPKRG